LRRARENEAERRPVTVMFCDLVGSTSLAATLDPEDWRDLVSAYLDGAAEAVAQYGGHVAKRLGDGLMALFGYPTAQENDAERAARAGLYTPLIGREDDLAFLLKRWERARGGEGQFIQIIGEPGLGKSRLIEEFRNRLAEAPHTWVEWSASQLLQNTALNPLTEWGRQRFGADLAADRRLAELESSLTQVKLNPAELAPLLDIPLESVGTPELTPDELRRRQLAAIVAWMLAGARAQPLVFAFEDLHWADPTSLDLLKMLAERGAAAPLMVVATARPEFRAPWATRSHHGVV
jgi:hypothetical protein